jgi:hypothetical protein
MASYAVTLDGNNLLIIASGRQRHGHLLVCLGSRVPDLRMLGPTMSILIGLGFCYDPENTSLDPSARQIEA